MAGRSGKPQKAAKRGRGVKTASKASSKGRGKKRNPAVDTVEVVDPENDAAARQALLASDKLYYRIGEVSRITGVKAHVLRYWETEFRWMAPPKSAVFPSKRHWKRDASPAEIPIAPPLKVVELDVKTESMMVSVF